MHPAGYYPLGASWQRTLNVHFPPIADIIHACETNDLRIVFGDGVCNEEDRYGHCGGQRAECMFNDDPRDS